MKTVLIVDDNIKNLDLFKDFVESWGYETVTAQQGKDAISLAERYLPDIILLDVRTTGEYSRGKIADSINVPLDDVAGHITSKIPDKSAKVYVYCLSGSRSIFAVESMLQLGYANVFNVTNGLLAWRSKGYPVSA